MNQKTLNGILLDEQIELSLNELCKACSSSAEWIIELVEEGFTPRPRKQAIAEPVSAPVTETAAADVSEKAAEA